MKRKFKIIQFLVLASLLIGGAFISTNIDFDTLLTKLTDKDTRPLDPTEPISITAVSSGDTLFSHNQPIKLLGIVAPDPNHPLSIEAHRFTRNFIKNRPVYIEYDIVRYDQYDRLLAYIWVKDRLLNRELVKLGLAQTNLIPGIKYETSLKAAQEKAQLQHLGLWSNPKTN